MILLSSFLGCLSLKRGTIIIGITSIVLHIFCAVFNNNYAAVFGANGGNFVYNILGMMSSIIMINGAKDVSLIAAVNE